MRGSGRSAFTAGLPCPDGGRAAIRSCPLGRLPLVPGGVEPLGRVGLRPPWQGDLLAGALALQDLTHGIQASQLRLVAVPVPVLVFQAERVAGEAGDTPLADRPATLLGAGGERLDRLGDRQLPCRLRRLAVADELLAAVQ